MVSTPINHIKPTSCERQKASAQNWGCRSAMTAGCNFYSQGSQPSRVLPQMSWRTTYNISESSFGKNSFRRATPSNDLRERSMVCSSSQCGSNGWISVITCTSRSCDKPKEHSVKKVAFVFWVFLFVRLFCDIEKTRRGNPLQSTTSVWLLGRLAAKG